MKIENVLPLLRGVKPNRSGWTARCPAHDDRRPSLSISLNDGHVLLNCFAGCAYVDVVSALERLGLGSSTDEHSASSKRTTLQPNFESRSGTSQKRGSRVKKTVVATYDYADLSSNFAYQVMRYQVKDANGLLGKAFGVRRRDESGKWVYELGNVKPILYRLPELKEASEVYVVEGEKDVDSLTALGVTATCNPFGAGRWRDEFSEALKDKTVIIWPDNDEPGEKHAAEVANSLAGRAREIKVAKIPRVSAKGDITDFLAAGGIISELRDIAASTPQWDEKLTVRTSTKKENLSFTPLPEFLREPDEANEFVWADTLPTGGFSVCSAKPKVGKSTFARNLAAAVATGATFLGRSTVRGKVLCIFLEEKRSEIKRHFERMGANDANILIHTGPAPNSLGELEQAIIMHDANFAIIDPLCRLLRVSDLNEYAGVAKAIEPFVDIARRTGAHIMALHHESKSDRSGGDGMLGSSAIFGSVDCNLKLKQQGQTRTLESIQRYGTNIDGMTIALQRETGILTTSGEFRDVISSRIHQKILEVLALDAPLTGAQIKSQISSFSNGAIHKALQSAVESGAISKTGSGKKNSPSAYSRICAEQ